MNDEEKLREALFTNKIKKIRGQYNKDLDKAREFSEAVRIVDELMQKTGKFAYRADDPDEPLYVHSIEVKWFDAEVELQTKEWIPLFKATETFNTIKLPTEICAELDTWMFCTQIYTEVEAP